MEKNNEIVENFKSILKKQGTKEPFVLYRDDKPSYSSNNICSPSEILSNLSRQIRAIQSADCTIIDTGDRRNLKTIGSFKRSTFLPVDMLPRREETNHQRPPKFETQGVSDTQLLSVVQDAEAFDPGGITQEFNTTFHHISSDDDEDVTTKKPSEDTLFPIIDISLKEPAPETDIHHDTDLEISHNQIELIENNVKNSDTINIMPGINMGKEFFHRSVKEKNIVENSDDKTQASDSESKNTQILNEDIITQDSDQLCNFIDVHALPSSPVLDFKSKTGKTTSLVFNLDMFETFEQVALPVVQESANLEIAKQLINSQIIGKELRLQFEKEPLLTDKDSDIKTKEQIVIEDRISPIILYNQELIVEKYSEPFKISSKKSEDEELLEDEILFSSDEEIEKEKMREQAVELSKIDDLPFTCALETSFYKQVDVLDKTMYVGFQTASNNSIEISTESFSKAKSILDKVDSYKDNLPLKDLVNVCESHIEDVAKLNEDPEIVRYRKEQKTTVDSLAKLCEKRIKNRESVDKRTEISTTSESENITKNCIVDAEIIQSQILPFSGTKTKCKSEKQRIKRKPRPCVQQTGVKETDFCETLSKIEPMILDFENKANVRSDEITSESNVKNVNEGASLNKNLKEENVTFEGFQTASNKIIKLSEKALARSRKVFQDIDLQNLKPNFSRKSELKDAENEIPDTMIDDFQYSLKDLTKNTEECCLHTDVKYDKEEPNKLEKNITMERPMDKNYQEECKTKDKTDIFDANFDVEISSVLARDNCKNKDAKAINNTKTSLLGLRTASNKEIKISDVALTKSKSMLNDLMEDKLSGNYESNNANTSNINNEQQLLGFKTASNKDIRISNVAIAESKSLLNDLIQDQHHSMTGSQNIDDRTSDPNKYNKAEVNAVSPTKSQENNELQIERQSKPSTNTGNNIQSDVLKTNLQMENNADIQTITETMFESSSFLKNATSNENCSTSIKTKNSKSYLVFESQNTLEEISEDISKTIIDEFQKDDFEESDSTESDAEPPFYGFESKNTEEIKSMEDAKAKIIVDYENQIKDIFSGNSTEKLTTKTSNRKEINTDLEITCSNNASSKFKGFQTAKNKPINISNKALLKSKKMFQDIELTEPQSLQESQVLPSERKDENAASAPKFEGFKTASKKPIKISEQAIARSKKVFQGIDDGDKLQNNSDKSEPRDGFDRNWGPPSNLQGFRTAIDKEIFISEKALANTKDIFQDLNKNETVPQNAPFQGFQTASNKQVIISEDALATSKNIFKDVSLCNAESNTEPKFGGFRTASNKQINISEEALIKSKTILQEAEFKTFETITSLQGFKTASCKNVNISKEALEKSKQLFKDIECDMDSINYSDATKPISFIGFQTANNKPLKISKQALAKSKHLFKDIDSDLISVTEHIEEPKSDFKGFRTASNKKVTVSEKSLAKSKMLFQDLNNDYLKINEQDAKTKTGFESFHNASNKKVNMSENAMARSKILLQDIDNDYILNEQEAKAYAGFQVFQTASNKTIQISKEALAKSKNLLNDIDSDASVNANEKADNIFKCFQTASNKKVISEDALKRSKRLFEDIDSEYHTTENQKIAVTPSFQGFQTASNKKVKISEEALEKSKRLFKGIEDNFPINVESNVGTKIEFKGFQTASNKKVKISEEALKKSKMLFQDINKEIKEDTFSVNVESDIAFKGFQTASNKKVLVSEEALAKSKAVFQNIYSEDSNQNTEKVPSFRGFQTVNNKKVGISEDALKKSKKLFEDIDKDTLDVKNTGFRGFQTGNNKEIEVLKEALEIKKYLQNIMDESNEEYDNATKNKDMKTQNKSRTIYEEVRNIASKDLKETGSESKSLRNKSTLKANVSIDVASFVDTQVVNNFEKSLHTEDFINKTPRVSKRSGSPILSCPKAKRRKKFEIPYSQKVVEEKVIQLIENKVTSKSKNTLQFDESYKKIKKYTLKDLNNIERDSILSKPDTDGYICNFSFNILQNFEFFDNRNDISNTKLTIADIKNIFLENVNQKLVPGGWLDNHIKLILWKLISYEIRFPKTMKGVTTAKNLLNQLKYRYNKELYNAERPALRKIMEKDDIASKTLVLCVVGIVADGKIVTNILPNTTTTELLLTDGWYTIKGTTDRLLAKLVASDKIRAGTKIVTNGAELVGGEQGVSPWEDISSLRLKLSGNSTRPAKWDTRLGYHTLAAILTSLSTISAEGGKISKLRLYVTRVYPALYVERFEDGSTVTRSERLEHLHLMKYETDRQALMEKLYEEAEKEISDQESQESESMETDSKRRNFESGSQIANMMKRRKDPAEFRSHLTSTQADLLQDYSAKERERLLHQIQTRVQDKIAKLGLQPRNVVPLLKVRVADVDEKFCLTKALLSIWKPNDAIVEIVREGSWIEVLNIVPTAVRYSEIQLSAGRQSIFKQSKYKEDEKTKLCLQTLKRTCHLIKDLVKNPALVTEYNEIDTVGFIFQIDPTNKEFDSNKHQFQNVYLTDPDKNIICVNFWGGLKKFGFENVLGTSQIVACTNLQKRAGNTRKNIQQFRVTEFSYFTKTPKLEMARKTIGDMSKIFSSFDKSKFIADCLSLRQNYFAVKLHYNESVSPYRIPNIDINTSRNKAFVDSPLAQKRVEESLNINLSGLDFESTFKQTEPQELSPKTLLRKQQIKERIAKLKMYGEPPPLSPMPILNKSKNAGNAFKSPFSRNDVSVSIASGEKFLQNVPDTSSEIHKYSSDNINRSPVILNKTFVKRSNVNPVKLNFDENNKSQIIDDFADEFNGSPPLSLE